MRVLIASYNLISEKSHLMPWRYVCEAAEFFNSNGHHAIVVSIENSLGDFTLEKENLLVKKIRKNKAFLYDDINALIKEHAIDVIFWPVSWREASYRLQALKNTNKPLIGYFPGGMYSVKDVIYAVKSIGLKASLPYVIEALSPKKRQLSRFRHCGFKELITLTDWTAQCVKLYGWSEEKITVALPGKENVIHNDEYHIPDEFKQWLGDLEYLIFMGPPTPIRGGFELLEAFDRVADISTSIRLVCLFRSDVGVDQSSMKAFISGLKNKDRIYVVWQSLERPLLEAFIANAYAIALPFVVVPSEIPLALIDAASYGKPVITTNCGGSGKYVEQYGVTVNLSKIAEFSDKLLKLIEDESFYLQKCSNARSTYDKHPTWNEMSKKWFDVAGRTVS